MYTLMTFQLTTVLINVASFPYLKHEHNIEVEFMSTKA